MKKQFPPLLTMDEIRVGYSVKLFSDGYRVRRVGFCGTGENYCATYKWYLPKTKDDRFAIFLAIKSGEFFGNSEAKK